MSLYKFGFIGAGNMGGALASAVCKKYKNDVVLCDAVAEKSQELATKLGCASAEILDVVKNSKYIFLGVKPQVMQSVIDEIKPVLTERSDRFILVTMAAGIKISSFNDMLGCKYPIIRIMPNTPVSVGKGMILYSLCKAITTDEETEFCDALEKAGMLDKLDEELIDAGCAISGCGPAFVYLFAKHFAKAGMNCGLDSVKALKYAAQTLSGAAELLLNSGHTADELIDMVCSPGGSTIEGVKSFNASNFEDDINAAVNASFEKTKLLGK